MSKELEFDLFKQIELEQSERNLKNYEKSLEHSYNIVSFT